MTTPTGGVPDLALMLTGDNTVTQAKELLPPQHNAASASKKITDEKPTSETKVKQSKQREEEYKHNVLPQGPTTGPGVNQKSETMAKTDREKSKSEKPSNTPTLNLSRTQPRDATMTKCNH